MKRVSRIGENIGPRIPSKLLNEDTEELNLHCNHVSTLLIHHNSNNRLSLRELNLSSNKLGYEGGNRRHDSTKYVNLLYVAPKLQKLDLGANGFNTASLFSQLRDLTNARRRLANLVSLNLSRNEITSVDGIERLFPRLVCLDISHNKIGRDALSEVVGVLASLTKTLEKVCLFGNPLCAESAYNEIVVRACRGSALKELDGEQLKNYDLPGSTEDATTLNIFEDGDVKPNLFKLESACGIAKSPKVRSRLDGFGDVQNDMDRIQIFDIPAIEKLPRGKHSMGTQTEDGELISLPVFAKNEPNHICEWRHSRKVSHECGVQTNKIETFHSTSDPMTVREDEARIQTSEAMGDAKDHPRLSESNLEKYNTVEFGLFLSSISRYTWTGTQLIRLRCSLYNWKNWSLNKKLKHCISSRKEFEDMTNKLSCDMCAQISIERAEGVREKKRIQKRSADRHAELEAKWKEVAKKKTSLLDVTRKKYKSMKRLAKEVNRRFLNLQCKSQESTVKLFLTEKRCNAVKEDLEQIQVRFDKERRDRRELMREMETKTKERCSLKHEIDKERKFKRVQARQLEDLQAVVDREQTARKVAETVSQDLVGSHDLALEKYKMEAENVHRLSERKIKQLRYAFEEATERAAFETTKCEQLRSDLTHLASVVHAQRDQLAQQRHKPA